MTYFNLNSSLIYSTSSICAKTNMAPNYSNLISNLNSNSNSGSSSPGNLFIYLFINQINE